jgi:Galactose oxidase, central domain
MGRSLTQRIIFTLVTFSLFLITYSIHFANISLAQEKVLENGWTGGTPMPTPRTEVTSANLDDDDVYVIGGFTSDGETTDVVEMYNATSDSWKTDIAPLPVPLHHALSVSPVIDYYHII